VIVRTYEGSLVNLALAARVLVREGYGETPFWVEADFPVYHPESDGFIGASLYACATREDAKRVLTRIEMSWSMGAGFLDLPATEGE
jgi:hypothetical protein